MVDWIWRGDLAIPRPLIISLKGEALNHNFSVSELINFYEEGRRKKEEGRGKREEGFFLQLCNLNSY
ncbi:hypothetical protein [Okeania sp. KiyG1]|uniref:hypothetical protein n=1 Tax=Okeania sp. KiyG1 TaxID=2720165 RepID=UPI001F3734FC|nr:hypothetical protein [Okeania sp. KiyG1]